MTSNRTTKPILFNGFKIDKDLTVKNRLEKVFFTEVYLLSDDKYLYLFTNLRQNEILDKGDRYKLINITVGDQTYLGIITDDFSHDKVTDIVEDLTVAKGFECVAGMEELKALLANDVIKPLLDPEKYKKFKLSIPNGILLFGPPGCGKTFIVRKLAEELGYTFIELKHSDVGSSYVYGTVGKIAKIFEIAKLRAPSIVFIDELSGLVPKRENLGMSSMHKEEEVNEFLMQLNDAADSGVLVVGATNYPDRIDTAILRAGRMDKLIYVPPPDLKARKELFKMGLSGRPHEESIDCEKLAKLTDYYVSSDIDLILDEAAREAINEDKPITEKMILLVISKIKPSISKKELEYFQQFAVRERK